MNKSHFILTHTHSTIFKQTVAVIMHALSACTSPRVSDVPQGKRGGWEGSGGGIQCLEMQNKRMNGIRQTSNLGLILSGKRLSE